MKAEWEEADKLVRITIKGLTMLLGEGGEDISFYNPSALDADIERLLKAKYAMMCARSSDE